MIKMIGKIIEFFLDLEDAPRTWLMNLRQPYKKRIETILMIIFLLSVLFAIVMTVRKVFFQ